MCPYQKFDSLLAVLRTSGLFGSVAIHDVRSAPGRETEDVERDTLDRVRQTPEGNEPIMSYYGSDVDAAEADSSFDDPTDALEANGAADDPDGDLGDGAADPRKRRIRDLDPSDLDHLRARRTAKGI